MPNTDIISQFLESSKTAPVLNEEPQDNAPVEQPIVEQEESTEVETIEKPTTFKTFEEELKERSGGKYEKWEDLEASINAPVYKTEFAQKLDAFLENGGDPKEFVHWNTMDIDAMDSLDIARMALKLENPEYSDEMITDELTDLYGVEEYDDEELEQKARKKAEIKLQKDTLKYKEAIKQYKEQFNASAKPIQQTTTQEVVDPEKIKQYQELIDKTLANKTATLPFSKEGDKKFSYELDDDVVSQVKDMLVDPKNFFKMYSNQDGIEQFKQDIGLLLMMKKGLALKLADTIKAEVLENEAKTKTNAKYNTPTVANHKEKSVNPLDMYVSQSSYNKNKN